MLGENATAWIILDIPVSLYYPSCPEFTSFVDRIMLLPHLVCVTSCVETRDCLLRLCATCPSVSSLAPLPCFSVSFPLVFHSSHLPLYLPVSFPLVLIPSTCTSHVLNYCPWVLSPFKCLKSLDLCGSLFLVHVILHLVWKSCLCRVPVL